jgi:hypothetical protein
MKKGNLWTALLDEKGTITDPEKLKKFELSYYQANNPGWKVHDDGEGNLTVVDEKGIPVESPPTINTYQGQYYLSYPGQDVGLDDKGTVTNPELLNSCKAEYFSKEIHEMYIHDDGKGTLTVVGADGKPVDSPPVIYTYQGKTYATYPGTPSPFDSKGTLKDPSKLFEIKDYLPDWIKKLAGN